MGLKHIPFSTEKSHRCRQRLRYCSRVTVLRHLKMKPYCGERGPWRWPDALSQNDPVTLTTPCVPSAVLPPSMHPSQSLLPQTHAFICFHLLSKSGQPHIMPGTQDVVGWGRNVIHSIHVNYYSYFYPHFSAENLFTSALQDHKAAVQGPILPEFARALYSIT